MHQRPRSGLPVHTAPALHSVMEISICKTLCGDLVIVSIGLAHLVTEEVAPIAWLNADGVGQAALAVRLAPGQRLVTVEVSLSLSVGVVGQLERDTA